MREARQRKTAALLRAEIAKRAGNVLPTQAVALAGGDIWEQVVMSETAHPRYRLEAWQAIGRAAEILGDARQSAANEGITIDIGADLARELAQLLMNKRKNE